MLLQAPSWPTSSELQLSHAARLLGTKAGRTSASRSRVQTKLVMQGSRAGKGLRSWERASPGLVRASPRVRVCQSISQLPHTHTSSSYPSLHLKMCMFPQLVRLTAKLDACFQDNLCSEAKSKAAEQPTNNVQPIAHLGSVLSSYICAACTLIRDSVHTQQKHCTATAKQQHYAMIATLLC